MINKSNFNIPNIRSRIIKSHLKKILLILLIIISLITITITKSESKFANNIKQTSNDLLSPIVEILSYPFIGFKYLKQNITEYFFVMQKNKDLRTINKEIRQKLTSMTYLEAENIRLKKLLSFVSEANFKYITARVVSNNSNPYTKSVIINAGSNHGVIKGQTVINEDGLVGIVVSAGLLTSRVMLVTDINSNIPVITYYSRLRAIASGNNSKYADLEYISANSDIDSGEIVITSGDGELLPPGIPVGKIYFAKNEDYKIIPLVRISKLEFVNILLKDE